MTLQAIDPSHLAEIGRISRLCAIARRGKTPPIARAADADRGETEPTMQAKITDSRQAPVSAKEEAAPEQAPAAVHADAVPADNDNTVVSEHNTATAEKPKNLHSGHRARLRSRARETGLDSFEPHQVLELLLFYTIPRRDTNDLAHVLMNEFGSLHGVFEAKYEDLVAIKGISENTATFLRLIPQLARRYVLSKNSGAVHFSSLDECGKYLTEYYIGVTVEMPVLLLLDRKNDLITPPIVLDVGTPTTSLYDARAILTHALRHGSDTVVLAHNHPNGAAKPSDRDIASTRSLKRALDAVGIRLESHIIVGKDGYLLSLDW